MKRYLLFVYDVGYDSYDSPKGWDAFEGDFDDAQKAAEKGRSMCPARDFGGDSVWEVVDTTVKQVVLTGCGNDNIVQHRKPPTDADIAAHPEMRPVNTASCEHNFVPGA